MYKFSQDTIVATNESYVILMSTKTEKFIVLDNPLNHKPRNNLDSILELFSLNCNADYDETLNFLWDNQYIKKEISTNNVIPLKYPYTFIVDSCNLHSLLGHIERTSKGYDKLINEIIIKNPNTEYFLHAKDIIGHSKHFSILFDDHSSFKKNKQEIHSTNSYADRIYIYLNSSNWELFLRELAYFTACPAVTFLIDFCSLTEFSIKYIANILNQQNFSYSFDIYLAGRTEINPIELVTIENKLLSLYEQDKHELLYGFPLTKPSRFCPQKQITKTRNFIRLTNDNKENCITCQSNCQCKKCIYKNICYFRGTKNSNNCNFKKILSKILED